MISDDEYDVGRDVEVCIRVSCENCGGSGHRHWYGLGWFRHTYKCRTCKGSGKETKFIQLRNFLGLYAKCERTRR